MSIKKDLNKSIKNNDIPNFILLFKDENMNLIYDLDEALIKACEYGSVDIVKILLKDERIAPDEGWNYALRIASKYGNLDVIKLLLKDKRVDPSDASNWAISQSDEFTIDKLTRNSIVLLLWKDSRVKNTLKNDDLLLYNKLIKQDIQNKISEF